MIERRRRPRLRVDSVAFIVTKTGNPVTCRVMDRSDDGARLFVDSVLGIPNQFRLVVQKSGEEFAATVAWRSPQEIGVAFLETQSMPLVATRSGVRSPIAIPLDPGFGGFAPEMQADSPVSGAECES